MNASNDSCLFTVRPRTPAIALDSHRQYVPVQNLYEDMPQLGWLQSVGKFSCSIAKRISKVLDRPIFTCCACILHSHALILGACCCSFGEGADYGDLNICSYVHM